MLKSLIAGLAFLFLASLVSAEIALIAPLEYKASHEEAVSLGALQAGETLELIFARGTGRENDLPWKQAIVENHFLPAGWKAVDSGTEGKTLLVKIEVPSNAAKGDYQFRVKLLTANLDTSNEVVDFRVKVQPGLVRANIANLKRLVQQHQPVSYRLTLLNDSIASHEVLVESTLGLNWFKPVRVSLPPRSSVEQLLTVQPAVASKLPFSFSVRSLVTGKPIDRFDGVLEVRPTLQGKLEAASFGFPFYTFSLAPFYFLNAFLAPFVAG